VDDYRLLCNEIMRLMLDRELFLFVDSEVVDGNNNVFERELRDGATMLSDSEIITGVVDEAMSPSHSGNHRDLSPRPPSFSVSC